MELRLNLKERLAIPAVAAPMFLVSGPDLVIETCRKGLLGTFPAPNQRTSEGLDEWLKQIRSALSESDAPFGINLTAHRSNARARQDLEATVRHQVPVVVTTLGVDEETVQAVHSYGGIVLHDAISVRHAVRAIAAGVDGVIAVCAGAGGHGGTANPFAIAAELRPQLNGKMLLISGGISDGSGIAGAIAAGADLAVLGTAFIATNESLAHNGHKQMICDTNLADIVYTDAVSGLKANFLGPSLERFGLLKEGASIAVKPGEYNVTEDMAPRVWSDLWSAGQSVGGIKKVVPVAELCERLIMEYRAAVRRVSSYA